MMDPFHVVHVAADKLTVCRQRIRQATTGHRGRTGDPLGDPLYGIRRTLRTWAELLIDKQKVRLHTTSTANDAHVAVEVTDGVYPSRQSTAASNTPRNRPGLPQPQALHLAVTHPLRPTPEPDQCTLVPEEP